MKLQYVEELENVTQIVGKWVMSGETGPDVIMSINNRQVRNRELLVEKVRLDYNNTPDEYKSGVSFESIYIKSMQKDPLKWFVLPASKDNLLVNDQRAMKIDDELGIELFGGHCFLVPIELLKPSDHQTEK